ncbi:uncharacterized protein LOC122506506 [Leptopilina heterotoma]|uniref:uncharacterized protein LOC122506506 n=1 Tax=Leptopilina heterotoma TaxID=63436 RepID=UPI001CA9A5E6|nr:uncharacterized protein LOC122506506 [Leptopilina heterotoma]
MKYLEVVLFAVIVNGYAFTATAEKTSFNNITFDQLEQLCSEQHHDIYENETRKLVDTLLSSTTNNCSDSIPQIKEIVSRIIPCFNDENMPNESDLNTIYEDITKKLCIHYQLVNFKKDNNCFDKEKINNCLQKNLELNQPQSDDVFYSLAMLHTKADCSNLEKMMFCLTGGDNLNKCTPEFKNQREDLLKKYSSILRCI